MMTSVVSNAALMRRRKPELVDEVIALRRRIEELEAQQTDQSHAAQMSAGTEPNRSLDEFAVVVDAIDYGILYMDSDLRARVANRAYLELWGIPTAFAAAQPTLAELIEFNRHTGVYDIPDSEFDAYRRARVARVRDGAIPPADFVRADGRTLRHQCFALPDGGRMLTYFDISERKRMEDALITSEQQFQEILKGSPIAVAISTDDQSEDDGIIEFSNPQFMEMLGIEADELGTARTTDFYTERQGREEHEKLLDQGVSLFNMETMWTSRDGREVWTMTSVSPIQYKGRKSALIWVYDISDLKRTQHEIEEKEQTFKTVLDNMPAAVFLRDHDGRFVLFNREYKEIYQVDEENFYGKTVHDVLPKAEADAYAAEDRRVIETGEALNFETTISRSGSKRVLATAKFPIYGLDGKPEAVGGIEIDITARKQAEKELAEKEAYLSLALDNMSDGMFLMGKDENYILINDRYKELTGLPPELLSVGKSVRKVVEHLVALKGFPSIESDRAVDERMEQLSGSDPVRMEMHVPNGPILELRHAPAGDVGAVIVATDLTERIQQEEKLASALETAERAEVILRDAVESISEGFVIYDKDDRMVICNEKYRELFPTIADIMQPGVTFEELIDTGLARGQYGGVTAEREKADLKKERMDNHNNPTGVGVNQQMADGRWMMVRERRTSSGGIVGIRADITELKNTEEQLQDAINFVQSSIKYASRIQRSMLPDESILSGIVNDHFVWWEPRDVVGGDIYWFGAWGDGFIVILGDCTGHGVPGAFMTLISIGALERALTEVEGGKVGALITRMHQYIQLTLRQHYAGGDSDDGIELGACYFVPEEAELTFAGARFEVFVHDGNDISVVKGTKKGMGYRNIPYDQEYEENKLTVCAGDRIYITTDGFTDQVGGANHRMFGKKRLKELLLSIQDLPMSVQKERLQQALETYQAEESRRDDVSFIGFELL